MRPSRAPSRKAALTANWSQLLTREQNGAIAATQGNVTVILQHDPEWEGVLGYDSFADRATILARPPWDDVDVPVTGPETGPWTDVDTARLVNWLERHPRMRMKAYQVEAALLVAAEACAFHPVRSYLGSLKWDGVKRLDNMLRDYFGGEDSAYVRGVSCRWMISAVARVMQPGCQADCTLVLESPQGWGKSSALRCLVPEAPWYAETTISLGNKDSYQNLHGVWIYGLDELDSLKGAELTRTKNFLTATADHYRPSYARRAKTHKRQNVFVGTTNDAEYLKDSTGNRRFWPVRVTKRLDVSVLAGDRDQLWAETYQRYSGGEAWHVNTDEFRLMCEAEQAARVSRDPWEEILEAWKLNPRYVTGRSFNLGAGVTSTDFLEHVIGLEPARVTRADEMRAGRVLRATGFEKMRDMRGGDVRVDTTCRSGTKNQALS